jgi:hypothetical protein
MTGVHCPPLLKIPGMVQAQVYCPPELLTPAFAEHVAAVVADISGVAFTHTIRDAFPAKRKGSIADEAAAAWASPKRRFRISNAAGHPGHAQLLAGRMPRKSGNGRADYGYVTLLVNAGANAALAVAENLGRLAGECRAVFARADAPDWGIEPGNVEAFATLAMPVAPDWILAERIGWVNYLPPEAFSASRDTVAAAFAPLGVEARDATDGGCLLRLSSTPLRDAEPSDRALHRSAWDLLAGLLRPVPART